MINERRSFEDEEYLGGQSLEEELLGKGYLNEVPSGSSLAAELQSATNDLSDETTASPTSPTNTSKLASMALDRRLISSDLSSPLGWSAASIGVRSRRSSLSSTWSSINEHEDDDMFEVLKRQMEELKTAIWETKTILKMVNKTLALDTSLQGLTTFISPFEHTVQSVVNLIDVKCRDRDRQSSFLFSFDMELRKELNSMSLENIQDMESLMTAFSTTLNDSAYSYENPVSTLRSLSFETTNTITSFEEVKEIMYVNKYQVQEFNSRTRAIAKLVHDLRMDMRSVNKVVEDEDHVVLEKGEAAENVKGVLWGLDDLDTKHLLQVQKIEAFLESIQL